MANIVGIYPSERVTTMSDEMWDDVIATNLTGVFIAAEPPPPACRPGTGTIVSIASASAAVPLDGFAAYAASKAGIEAFSRVLALEAAPTVRVNVVSPGPIMTWEAPEADGADPLEAAADPLVAVATAITSSPWLGGDGPKRWPMPWRP